MDLAVAGELLVPLGPPSQGARVLRGVGGGKFGPASAVACDRNAKDIVAADLDGDGAPDLATANASSDTVSILFSNGDGSFKPEVALPSLREPAALIASDLDGDGTLDLAAANRSSSDVLVLLGRGDGSFGPTGPFYSRNRPVDVAAEDLDGDGQADLVTVADDGSFSILRGIGRGSFGRASIEPTGLFNGQGLVAGDLDHDGIPDLAFSGLGWISTFRGQGAGSFDPVRVLPAGGGTTPVRADLDEDGLPDLVLASAEVDGAFHLLLNRSGSRPPADCNRNDVPDVCEIADDPKVDADGDGVLDDCESIRPALRDCNGNRLDDGEDVASGASRDCDRNGIPDDCEFRMDRLDLGDAQSYPTGYQPREVKAADLNGDGHADVVTADEPGTLSVLLGRGDGTLEPVRSLSAGERTSGVACSDLNRDGELDLIGANVTPADLVVYLGTGDGDFKDPSRIPLDVNALSVAAVDLDGDGVPDLATSNGVYTPDAGARALLGNGDGTFRISWTGYSDASGDLVAADFDGDGAPDLAVKGIRGIAVFPGRGAGTFGEARRIGMSAVRLAAGDLDGDGLADLAATLLSQTAPGVVIFYGRPDRSFLPLPIPTAGFAPVSPVLRDLDGNGSVDLAVAATEPDAVAVFRQVGPGVFASPILAAATAYPSSLAAADLDGDGATDLVASGVPEGPGFVSVLRGYGTGSFRGASIISTGSSAREFLGFFITDLDGDGIRDIVDGRVGSYEVIARLGNGDGTYRPAVTTLLSLDLSVVAAGDLDGDALTDLLLTDLRVLAGRGDGGFIAGPKASLELGERAYYGEWATADLDGDGRRDLAWADTRNMNVYLNRGGLVFETPEDPYPLGPGAEDVLVADLDGDGIPDLAATGAERDEVWVTTGKGEGIFLRPARRFPLNAPGGPRLRPDDLAAADLDLDGFLDLVTADSLGEDVSVLIGSGGGWFLPPLQYPLGVPAAELAAGDLDADGIPDVAAGAQEAMGLAILLSRGDGTLATPARRFDAGPGRLEIFDADGDARDDLLVASKPSYDAPVNVILYRNLSLPLARDCNGNGVPDSCDIDGGLSRDVDGNGVPDACEPDCDGDGLPDPSAIRAGTAQDCNGNRIPDRCDLAGGTSPDVDGNSVPDECEADCDRNGVPDARDIATGASADCNRNGVPDPCDLAGGKSRDRDENGVPDECEPDCNRNGAPDSLDIRSGASRDCDVDAVPDDCQIAADVDLDVDRNGILDGCEPDCNRNGLPDSLEIRLEYAPDCNGNLIPDACEIAEGRAADCDGNGRPDACDLAAGSSADTDGNGVPDSCEGGMQVPGDCDGSGALDLSDALCVLGALYLGTPERFPCGDGSPSAPSNLALLDWQGDRRIDVSDGVGILTYLFLGGPQHRLTPEGTNASGCLPLFGCPGNPACGG